ncbi:MAG: hypothetical protein HFJ12_03115 [Bacilli bacterium]|nr:hypothetical protein [Bacilli bacterium]
MKWIKNKNERMILVVVSIILIIGTILIIIFSGNRKENIKSVEEIISQNEESIIFVNNSDSKKCKNCQKIKRYLDKNKMTYVLYDVRKHTNDEYIEMLQSLSINPNSFHYPAIIYVKNGKAYADLINIKDPDKIEKFIKKYDIKSK